MVWRIDGPRNDSVNPVNIVVNEIHFVGSRCGRFEPALRLLENGLIDVEPLISGVFSFDQVLQAFQTAQEPNTLKILLDFEDA